MPSCNSCFLMLNVVLETSDDFLLLQDRAQRVEYYYGHAQVEAVNLCRPLLSIFFHKKKRKKVKKKKKKEEDLISWSTCSPCTKRTNFSFYLFFGSRNYSRDLEYQIQRLFFFGHLAGSHVISSTTCLHWL